MSKVKIVQGTDRKIVVRLENSIGDAWDLTEVTDITACFKLTDGTTLKKQLTVSGLTILNNKKMNGKVVIQLSDAETLGMKISDPLKSLYGSFEIELDEGTDRQIIQFKDSLEIVKRLT